MALIQREGTYGSYWGDQRWSSHSLTYDQMCINATYIYSSLTDKGWSKEAIAGVLGNMQHESALNPGRWQNNAVDVGPAYGLVQWDPYTKYTGWAVSSGYSDYSTMDANIARIIYEVENNIQYIPTSDYPLSFNEFTISELEPYYLACAFAWNYERSAVVLWGTEEEKEALRQLRGGCANDWYEFLGGVVPTPPHDLPKERKGFNWVLFNRNRRRRIYG